MIKTDFLIIGGGVVGLSLARTLKAHFCDAKIILLEKEKACGLHASGRNSGVLHAGFYYSPDSLKAKFTRLGNASLKAYCEQKKIRMHACGKLIVTKNASELPTLEELYQRGKANGVQLEKMTAEEAMRIEPRVLTYEQALFSPQTATVDPTEVVNAMRQDAIAEGIEIHCETRYINRKKNGVLITTKGKYEAGFVVNAGGLYADKIARDFHFSADYRILPFKGIYLYSNAAPFSLNTHVYPVPELKNPFLGVHFTLTVDGRVKIGPTAIPAFWREQYDSWQNFNVGEFGDILRRQLGLLFHSTFDFKRLAWEEIKKYSRKHLVELAKTLVKDVHIEQFPQFGRAGIRAQLFNIKQKKLEMDFILEGDQKSIHILNAVSPGFTSALPFSQYVCEQIERRFANGYCF